MLEIHVSFRVKCFNDEDVNLVHAVLSHSLGIAEVQDALKRILDLDVDVTHSRTRLVRHDEPTCPECGN